LAPFATRGLLRRQIVSGRQVLTRVATIRGFRQHR
jgi:hypothetical protein